MVEKRERREKKFDILFLKISNERKVSTHDVTSSLNRYEITFIFYASKDFRFSESTHMNQGLSTLSSCLWTFICWANGQLIMVSFS